MKRIIFYFLIGLLFLPLIDNLTGGFIHVEKLKGEYSSAQNIKFNTSRFFSNQYQNKKSKYLTESLNLYPLFIRINNQVLFSLFDKLSVRHAVLGKNNIIFDDSYIKSYYGQDFVGKEFANERIQEVSFLNKILKLYNKRLCLCFLPGKTYFYPESIPSKLLSTKRAYTNAEYYTKGLQNEGIKVLNLINYLPLINDSSKSPIYPKESIHPSAYGLTLAADTLMTFIEQSFNWKLPEVSHPFFTSKQALYYENDILSSCNLLFPPQFNTTFAYPKMEFKGNGTALKTLVVGDSFYKLLYKNGFQKHILGSGDYWFYGETYWPSKESIYNHNIRLDFFNHDMIMLFVSEATLYLFPYNLDTKILERILPFDDDIRLQFLEMKFAHNHQWSETVKEKAKQNNISFEEQKKKDIDYMLFQSYEKLDSTDKELRQYILQMKADSNWYQSIVQKANNKAISIENALMQDAIYLYHQKHKQ